MTPLDELARLVLLATRPGVLVLATPIFGGQYAPTLMRVGLPVLIALLLAPVVPVPQPLPAAGLVFVMARELAIGLALAMAIRALIAGIEFAGHFSGYQIGLSVGALIDPQSGVRNTVIAVLYANLAAVLCLMTGAHHALLRALVQSYTSMPIGLGGIDQSLVAGVGRLLGLVFVLGVRVAMPVIIVMLLIEVTLGLFAKLAPALNVMIAGAPVRLLVGLLLISITVFGLPTIVRGALPAALDWGARLAQAFR